MHDGVRVGPREQAGHRRALEAQEGPELPAAPEPLPGSGCLSCPSCALPAGKPASFSCHFQLHSGLFAYFEAWPLTDSGPMPHPRPAQFPLISFFKKSSVAEKSVCSSQVQRARWAGAGPSQDAGEREACPEAETGAPGVPRGRGPRGEARLSPGTPTPLPPVSHISPW